ncbi:DUF2189 domain-containing protein [Aeromonas schubertii]|uniref:hypothetical protein n=1 Tax=Aeromonas schubertii TaxID=652 RepID=UPI0010A7E605|nr:hypothetical protein [Aeromonas schubertii]QCG50048.1 hypothetical protein E2P79_11270 [Aeromonas schubertii]
MRIGGDMERSLTQGYRLDIRGILQEGWTQTRVHGFGLLLAIAGVVAIWLLLTQVMVAPHLAGDEEQDLTLLLSLLITVLISPMTSALDMLGLQQSLGVRARAGQVFDFFRHFVRLGSLSLLSTLCTSLFGPLFAVLGLPVTLALVPSVLLGMGLIFSVPLVLERGVSPLQAILLSLRLFIRGLPTLLLLHGIMFVLFFLALIPMGLGLIWVAPLYYNIKGILYRDLCGIGVEVAEKPASPDHFNA